MTRHGGILGLAFLLGVNGHPARADYAARCELSPSGPGTLMKASSSWPGTTCCENADLRCDASSVSPAIAAGRKNILLIVADDQSYCEYGFMLGVCQGSSPERQCRSNLDCQGFGSGDCVARTSGLGEATPLRLGDWTCRYRQPPANGAANPCTGNPNAGAAARGALDGDNNAWPFHASNFPCAGTLSAPNVPVPLTPHLDQIATFGTVFPRAYIGGNACKASRAVIHFGKPHRHLLELAKTNHRRWSMASWLLDNGHNSDVPNGPQEGAPPAGSPRYWPFLLGKGEVLKGHHGGYQGGRKGHLTEYKCEGTASPQACVDVADEPAGSSNFLKLPWEVREDSHGVLDLMNILHGRGRGRIEDRNVLVRNLEGCPGQGEEKEACCEPCYDDPDGPTTISGKNCSQCTSQLQTPFFVWFAPNQPHKRGDGADLRPLYENQPPGIGPEWLQHSARITQFDQGVGTAVDELKRHCVCGLNDAGLPTKQSLWDHTVVIFLSDHGFMMPEAKSSPIENTHRTPLIISTPEHRKGTLPARQLPGELAHAIDVFQTVMAYAGLPAGGDPIEPSDQTDYLFGRNLKRWVEGETDPVRPIVYGEDAGSLSKSVDRGLTRRRYLVTQPGLVGLCIKNGTDHDAELTGNIAHPGTALERPHARLCFLGGANDCPQNSQCKGASDGIRRCVNDPYRACRVSADCVEAGFCTGGACVYDSKGSLGDMARPLATGTTLPAGGMPSRTCSVDADCIPAGVDLCRDVILKVEMNGDPRFSSHNLGVVDRAWDVEWDPDQRQNLLAANGGGSASYLGNPGNGEPGNACVADTDSLRCKFESCLTHYWTLNTASFQWTGAPANCPWL